MYTLEQIQKVIEDRGIYLQGRSCVQQHRITRLNISKKGSVISADGTVREFLGSYDANFRYDEAENVFLDCACECRSFADTPFGCRHIAALMIAALERQQGSSRISDYLNQNRVTTEQLMEQKRRREETEKAERERRQAEYLRKEEADRQSAVRSLFSVPAAPSAPEELLSLEIRLKPDYFSSAVLLQLAFGGRKKYVVPNISSFFQDIRERREHCYGKQLTTDHSEEKLLPSDIPLLYGLMGLEDCIGQNKRQPSFSGSALDRLMHLLEGRTVLLQSGDDELPVQVLRGVRQLPFDLSQNNRDYLLKPQKGNFVAGTCGVYFFEPELSQILCAFGSDYTRLQPMLELSQRYPAGLRITDGELRDLCSDALQPEKGLIRVQNGKRILQQYLPESMTVRYLVDLEARNTLSCEVRFVYPTKTLLPGEDASDVRRNRPEEMRAFSAAKELFPDGGQDSQLYFTGSDESMFELLSEKLDSLQYLGEVLISSRLAGKNLRIKRQASLGITPSEGQLYVTADLDGITQEDAQNALAAWKEKKKYVRLKNGTFLSGDALEQTADFADLLSGLGLTADELAKGARLPAARALYLESALEERPELHLDLPQDLKEWLDRFRAAQNTEAEPPKGLTAELKPYQKTGLSWLCALNDAGFGGILADDMGLGKTIQTLAMLLREKEQGKSLRVLIVCPASLQLNWRSEAERFTPDLSCAALLGDADSRALALRLPFELFVTSYGQLGRDIGIYRNEHFTHVILDEAQNIKNASAQTARAVKTLNADHRLALTGTPIENNLSELWSIFDFLMPGYLSAYKSFRERFENPIVKEKNDSAERNLRLMTAPFILRRVKKDVLKELPDKVETTISCEMTDAQRLLYRASAAQLLQKAETDPKNNGNLWAGMLRLRQICCDPSLYLEDYTGGSGKREQCLNLIRESLFDGHRILLFSQFTSMLDLLESDLNAEGIETFMLTGETPKEERTRMVSAFNDGEKQVFLISLKAGGTGLNLTGADTVIHYDPWWNFAAQNQATDRAYRIGQDKGVQVFRLITVNTIEERILALQNSKKELSDAILSGGETLFTMNADLLRDLLRDR